MQCHIPQEHFRTGISKHSLFYDYEEGEMGGVSSGGNEKVVQYFG
jgi:hypothetical protein